MQGVGTLIRPIDLRAFPMHAVAHQSRRDAQRVTFIGPPAVHAQSEVFAVSIPVAAGLFLVEPGRLAWVVDGAAEFVCQNYIVEHNAEVVFVEFVDHFLWVGKHVGVPRRTTHSPCSSRMGRSPCPNR